MRSEPESGRGQDLCLTGGSYLAKRFGYFLAIEKVTNAKHRHNAEKNMLRSQLSGIQHWGLCKKSKFEAIDDFLNT